MKCNNCNFNYDKKTEFCPNCGIKVEKTKNKKKILIISLITIISILLISLVTILIINNSDSKNESGKKTDDTKELNKKNKATKKKNEVAGYEYYVMDIDTDNLKIVYDGDLGKNIKVDKVIYDTNGLHVLATNNNTIPVYHSIDLYFLDESGKRVDIGIGTSSNVEAGKQFATDVSYTSKKDFVDYELHVSADKIKSYEHMVDIDKSSLNITETGKSINVKYLNNNQNEVSLYFTVIFYKNNKVHFFDDLYLFLKPGEEGSIDSYYMYLPAGELNEKDYDRYEVIVSGAKYNDKDY